MNQKKLYGLLSEIDGRGYKAYKQISGIYKIKKFTLMIDFVQGDPFASPSRIRVRVEQKTAGFPSILFSNKSRRMGFEDYITRRAGKAIKEVAKGNRGTGKSGMIAIDSCGQEILQRTSVVVNEEFIEARMTIGLPARGRSILARQAGAMLFEELPNIVNKSLLYDSINQNELKRHVQMVEDQDFLRNKLKEMNLVCFIANGSVLPRESGISQKPMRGKDVISFQSPSSMKVEVALPNRGNLWEEGIMGSLPFSGLLKGEYIITFPVMGESW